jgi:hypothetical protein
VNNGFSWEVNRKWRVERNDESGSIEFVGAVMDVTTTKEKALLQTGILFLVAEKP